MSSETSVALGSSARSELCEDTRLDSNPAVGIGAAARTSSQAAPEKFTLPLGNPSQAPNPPSAGPAKSPDEKPTEPAAIPDQIREILNFEEEKDTNLVQLSAAEDAVLICAVAPYASVRVSPVDVVSASIGLHEEFAFEAVIDEISKRGLQTKKIMLLLNTLGGGWHSSFKVARALRHTFKEIEVYVPHIAASGGTLIALSGDKIVMGLMSQLSPLDPQVSYNGSYISALTCRRFYDRMCEFFEDKTKDEAPYPAQALVDKIDPYQMEEWQRAVDTSEQYAQQILEIAKYENAADIAQKLVRGFSQHDCDINYHGAKELGLRVELNSQSERNQRIWRHFRAWLGKFLLEESGTHIVRYVFPQQEAK